MKNYFSIMRLLVMRHRAKNDGAKEKCEEVLIDFFLHYVDHQMD